MLTLNATASVCDWHAIAPKARCSLLGLCRRAMTVTCATLLTSVRSSKEKVSEWKEKEAALRIEAASPGQPSDLAASMLKEAEWLQAAAHQELLKANCMEKLLHGKLLRCCN